MREITSAASEPPVSVVLATRNRPRVVTRAAQSILRCTGVEFRLFIIDQSDDASTRTALGDIVKDARVIYIPAPPDGLAAARNVGVAQCNSPLIAFTDDDCEVESDWLRAITFAFAADPAVGVTFGTVNAPAYDRTKGFIPAYPVTERFTASSIRQKSWVEGFGANMAVRRRTWEKLRGFDESMGAGSHFCAAEDSDFAIRALIAGESVHQSPHAIVTHHGFRHWAEARHTISGYMLGLGAANAKMMRLGGRQAWRPLAALAWRWIALRPLADLNHVPPRLQRLIPFARGAWKGLICPIDRSSGCFVDSGLSLRRAPGARLRGAGAPLEDSEGGPPRSS